MLSLIPTSWRYGLLALAVVLAVGAIYATGRSHGADAVQREWDADKAARMQIALAAEMRAREIERQMTTKLQEAQRAATERETKLAADAAAARAAAGSLRNTVTALRGQLSAATAEACRTTADAALAVFSECSTRLGEVAAAADGHASDAQLFADAWPE
jgi:seryl-tRNA synthetase